MLLGSDDNENKLRGAEGGSPAKEPSGYGDSKLFEATNNTQSLPEDDDVVKDSFMLSMKNNEPESVSEKLSTASAEASSSAPDFFGDDDELSNFVPDSSISAFKPLGDSAPSTPKETAAPANAFAAPAPKKEEPVKEAVKKDNTPLFTDDDPDFKSFADNTNTDPFKAGEELDFAMSSNAKESDFNTAPEVKNDPIDDLELDEEALAISPFKPKGGAAEPAPASAPAAEAKAEPVKEEPKTEEITKEEPKAEPAPSPAPSEAKDEPAPAKEDKKPNMQTYGNVKSGVNAFGKKEQKKPEEAPKAAPAPKAPHKSPFASSPSNSAPLPPSQQPIGSGRPGAPTPASTDPAKFRPIPQQQRPQPVVKKAPPAQRPAAVAAPHNAVVNQRPGMSDASANKPSPFQAPGSRPVAPAPKPAPAPHAQPISPVTTVNKSKKRGKGGIIIAVIAFLALLIIVLGIENFDKLFPNSEVSPSNTRETTTAATTTVEETTTTTAEETTTTTTVEETTETEESTDVTEETSEETTVETTEETTEATTAATTEATTAATTTAAGSSAGTASYRYSISNPHSNGSQFSFDLVITNTGNSDSSFAGSVESLDITLTVDPSEIEITGISSDYYTFTQDANDPCTFHGTPTTGTVPAGGELNTTITCTTSEPVQHFYITNYHFELK